MSAASPADIEKEEQEPMTAGFLPVGVANPAAIFRPGGKGMFKEFKEFAVRGNVLDMAVGIVIGAAFGRIVSSFVDDILMPPIGLLAGGIDFSSLFFSLTGQRFETLAQAKAAGAPTLNYGLFLSHIFSFLIVAFAVFLLVRQVNRLRRDEVPPPANTRECPYCLSTIPLKATRCAACTAEVKAAA